VNSTLICFHLKSKIIMINEMAPNISWSYDIFYNWYRKQLKYIDEEVGVGTKDPILAIVYESKRPKKKDLNTLEPFIKPNIKYAGVSPIQDPVNYPNGLYLLMEADSGKKKYMFAVFPTLSECPTPTIVGNHLTFVVDVNDTNTPCHFHSTYYTCQKIGSVYAWLDPHYKDYFSTTLELPKQGSNEVTDTIIKHPINQQHKHTILDIMRYPWKSGTSGGAKPRSASRAQTQANTHTYNARNIQSVAFSTLWLEREYRAMYAMGIVRENTGNVQWSVRLVRKGRDRVQPAYVFVTQSADETLFQTTLVQLILQNEPV
jgi:hypothetical protein